MKIKSIMSTDIEIVSPGTLLHEVAQKMRKLDAGYVLVADGDKLLGVITDRDMAIRCVADSHHPGDVTAAQIMTPEILYCQDTDEAAAVALQMSRNNLRRMVVLNSEKRMVGSVSLGDLAVIKEIKLIN